MEVAVARQISVKHRNVSVKAISHRENKAIGRPSARSYKVNFMAGLRPKFSRGLTVVIKLGGRTCASLAPSTTV